jgi:hypothetical protein
VPAINRRSDILSRTVLGFTGPQETRYQIPKIFQCLSRLSSAVEQRFCKPKVGSSILSAGTTKTLLFCRISCGFYAAAKSADSAVNSGRDRHENRHICSLFVHGIVGRMNALIRRRSPHRANCWHVYYGDVDVGWIGVRSGVPVDVDQWEWNCGFYPVSHRGQSADGTARSFKAARCDFAVAWRALLPTLTEADFTEYRRQRAWTAWMYAMWDTGHKLPTQRPDLRSRCFCGEAIDSRSTERHVYSCHMEVAE